MVAVFGFWSRPQAWRAIGGANVSFEHYVLSKLAHPTRHLHHDHDLGPLRCENTKSIQFVSFSRTGRCLDMLISIPGTVRSANGCRRPGSHARR